MKWCMLVMLVITNVFVSISILPCIMEIIMLFLCFICGTAAAALLARATVLLVFVNYGWIDEL